MDIKDRNRKAKRRVIELIEDNPELAKMVSLGGLVSMNREPIDEAESLAFRTDWIAILLDLQVLASKM